jgi:hypothetical protein
MKIRRIAAITAAFLFLMALAVGAAAQDNKKETQLRTVHGVVTDKADTPIAGCVVFLKNVRTNSVSSRFTESDGTYRFSGLDPNADYEVHAESEGLKSAPKTVSALDNRREMIINLKIDKKKA